MDLNEAMLSAKAGMQITEPMLLRESWTVRWVEVEKLFYYFGPNGGKRHKIVFNDAHRASYQWKVVT